MSTVIKPRSGFDSMAAWDNSSFQFADDIQRRGSSWSGRFSFEHGPGSSISRDDYRPPSPPASDEEAPHFHANEPPPHITDAIITASPPPSPRSTPPPSPRVDSLLSHKSSPAPSRRAKPRNPDIEIRERAKLANQLYAAACTGDLDAIRLLLEAGAPINEPTKVRGLYDAFKPPKPGTLSALAGAAGNGQLDACELLLCSGAALNPTMKESSSSPLHQACRVDDLEIARFLLEVGADVNSQNCYKTTPLMLAVKQGSPDLVALLLTYKPDFALTSFMHTAAIHWAIWPGHDRNLELMLAAGADPNPKMGDGATPLHCAAQCGFDVMVEILLRYGADPTKRNLDWKTPRGIAEAEGWSEVSEMLVKAEQRWKTRALSNGLDGLS